MEQSALDWWNENWIAQPQPQNIHFKKNNVKHLKKRAVWQSIKHRDDSIGSVYFIIVWQSVAQDILCKYEEEYQQC